MTSDLSVTQLKKVPNNSPVAPVIKETVLASKKFQSPSRPKIAGHITETHDKVLEESEQHVLVISADVSSREHQPSDEKGVMIATNNSASITAPVQIRLPSMGTLKLETSFLLNGYVTGIRNLPFQRERIMAREGIKFNLMIVGQTGLGKTTFMNTLFDTCLLPYRQKADDFQQGETKCIEIHRAFLEIGQVNLDLTITDTPGFGYKINNTFDWVPLINYIDEQLRSYIFQEEQPNRRHLKDGRVHCCLYFIEPTGKGLNALNVMAMRELAKRVNLIPIISKADSLSSKELNPFKKEIRDIMHEQGIKACRFLEDNNESYGDILDVLPFAIVSSERKKMNQDCHPIHVRETRWGTIEVENVDHCDFTLLKTVLLSNHLFDFIDSTEAYYESCRSSILRTRVLKVRDLIDGNSLPQELTRKLQGLNYDYIDSNGLKNYLCYSVFGKKELDLLVAEWSPIFIEKKWELRRKLHQVILLEDQKFQEWKKALQHKQIKFNEELESLRRSIDDLQSSCRGLETQILAAKTVHTTRSKTSK